MVAGRPPPARRDAPRVVVFDGAGRRLVPARCRPAAVQDADWAPRGGRWRSCATQRRRAAARCVLLDAARGLRGRVLFTGPGRFGDLAWSPARRPPADRLAGRRPVAVPATVRPRGGGRLAAVANIARQFMPGATRPRSRARCSGAAAPHVATALGAGPAPLIVPAASLSWPRQAAGTPSAARCSSAMSSLRMPNIACIARCARAGSASPKSSSTAVGTTCHDSPKRSFSQPHGPSLPPSDSLLPVVVDLGLVLAGDREGNGLVERELRPAVDRDEALAVELELDGHHHAGRSRPGVGVMHHADDARVLEYGDVEVRGRFGLVVEPEVRGDPLLHGCILSRGGSGSRDGLWQ